MNFPIPIGEEEWPREASGCGLNELDAGRWKKEEREAEEDDETFSEGRSRREESQLAWRKGQRGGKPSSKYSCQVFQVLLFNTKYRSTYVEANSELKRTKISSFPPCWDFFSTCTLLVSSRPRPLNAFDLVLVSTTKSLCLSSTLSSLDTVSLLVCAFVDCNTRGEDASSAFCSDLEHSLAAQRTLLTLQPPVALVGCLKKKIATAWLNWINRCTFFFCTDGTLSRTQRRPCKFSLLSALRRAATSFCRGKEGGSEGKRGGGPRKGGRGGGKRADAARRSAIVFSRHIRHPSYLR